MKRGCNPDCAGNSRTTLTFKRNSCRTGFPPTEGPHSGLIFFPAVVLLRDSNSSLARSLACFLLLSRTMIWRFTSRGLGRNKRVTQKRCEGKG
jgi:hypothetical protein